MKANEVFKHLENEAFYSQLIQVSVDGGEPARSILKDVQLNIGDSIHLSQLSMPEGVRLVELQEAGDDSDRQLAAVNAPRVEAEPSEDEDAPSPDVPTASDEGADEA